MALGSNQINQTPQKRVADKDSFDESEQVPMDPLMKQHQYANILCTKLFNQETNQELRKELEIQEESEYSDYDGTFLGNFDDPGLGNFDHPGLGNSDNEGDNNEDVEGDLNYNHNNANNNNNNANNEQPPDMLPDDTIRLDFLQYQRFAEQNYCSFDKEHVAAIELMDLLVRHRAPLNLYDSICKWHTTQLDATEHVPKKTLMKSLKKRYNMHDERGPQTRELTLPHSKSRINLVYQAFCHELQVLLTDPRITDDDYLFFDNNPLAAPPDEFITLGDINTGLHLKTALRASV